MSGGGLYSRSVAVGVVVVVVVARVTTTGVRMVGGVDGGIRLSGGVELIEIFE